MNTQYNYPNLKKAVELLDESNFTDSQLVAYDKYLDSIRSWNSSIKLSYEEGMEEGKKDERNLTLAIISDLKAGKSVHAIADTYNVEIEFVEKLQ